MTNDKMIDKEVVQNGYKNYHVRMSSDLLNFLCGDYTYKNAKRFSRLQAFRDLVARHCTSERKQEDMVANIECLSKSWGWSRPSVMKFIQNLETMNVLEVFNVVTSKMVRLRKDIVVFAPAKDVEK
ncbi:hypothetical protein [Segatella oulorum]|uniref:hypothetical protein n=1 Tax=Segatella oulorum TaxID=28136 RepID=UPI0028EFAEB5|nr:hypothetical protein [Segatella oulorum]